MFTKENTECFGKYREHRFSSVNMLPSMSLSILFFFNPAAVCLIEEDWLSGGEALFQAAICYLVMNAGDLSVGGEVGSPGVLPGGSMRSRSCPASPLPSLLSPVSCLYSLPALEKAEQGSNIEAASKLRVWLIAVSSYITGLPFV